MYGRLIPLRTDNIDNVAASDINTLEDFLRGLANGDYAFHALKIEGYGTDWVSQLPELKDFYDARGSAQGPVVTDGNNKIPTSQLPALAIVETYSVSTESAQLALDVQQGDICVRTDLQQSFIALNSDNASMDDWQLLQSPTDAVQSVDGRTGTVILTDLYEPKGTTHDDRYYTESEIDGFLDGKSDAGHTHDHASITGSGTKTHAQIDSHIDDAAKHREIDDTAGDGDTSALWSADKIYDELQSVIAGTAQIVDTPADGETDKGISSNWAFNHKHGAVNMTANQANTRDEVYHMFDDYSEGYHVVNGYYRTYSSGYKYCIILSFQKTSTELLINTIRADNGQVSLYHFEDGSSTKLPTYHALSVLI